MSLPWRKLNLPFVLFCVLLTILVVKVIAPSYLRAQTVPTTTKPASVPVPPADEEEEDIAGPSDPIAFCNTPGAIETGDYIAPTCGAGKDCPKISSFSKTGGVISPQMNYIQWMADGQNFKQYSNSIYFLYKREGGMIRFKEDTIWEPPARYCDGTTDKAFYRVYDGNTKGWGAPLFPTQASCGFEQVSPQFIKTFPKTSLPGNVLSDPLAVSPENLAGECNVTGQSNIPTQNTLKLVFQGPAKCGDTPVDAIALYKTGGAGIGEFYIYCKGLGLCAFYDRNEVDFSAPENQPRSWGPSTDICTLKGQSTKKQRYFEYNIQRNATESVLKNFYDEYNVSCMPKAQYELILSSREKCASTSRGCNNWNVSGDLQMGSNNMLFGLFRDETKTQERYLSNSPTAPERNESLETYLGTKDPNRPVYSAVGITKPTLANIDKVQAPIYTLTSLKTQCELVKNKLRSVENLCSPQSRIEGDKSVCVLDTKIPETNYTHLQLWNEVKSKDCEDLMDISNQGNEQLRNAITSTPMTMENAYRPAFIVAMTTFDGSNSTKNARATSSDVPAGTEGTANKFVVLNFLEVKVPAVGSDFIDPESEKAAQSSNGSIFYQNRNAYRDPLTATADLLMGPNQQNVIYQQEAKDRAEIRNKGLSIYKTDAPSAGQWYGNNGSETILCYKAGKLDVCDPVLPGENDPADLNAANYKDAIAPALLNFVNAAAPQICDNDEEGTFRFYNDGKNVKVAEQAKYIVSKLEPRSKVGKYRKQLDFKLNIQAQIASIDPNSSIDWNESTQLYFISPHKYNLEYVQKSFMSFLTTDQQAKLKLQGLGQLTSSANTSGESTLSSSDLDPNKFSLFMKTDSDITFREGLTVADAQTRGSVLPNPANPSALLSGPQKFSVGAALRLVKDAEGQIKNSVIWKNAAQAASLPTRLMALVQTNIDSATNKSTRRCTDESPEFATEKWFRNECGDPDSSPAPTAEAGSCKPTDGVYSHKSSTGRNTSISEGLMAAAIEVSKITCTPAEILVGLIAQETGGYTATNFNKPITQTLITGDPNQLVMRDFRCQFEQGNSPYDRGCGAFSWQLGYMENVYNKYKSANSDICMNQLAVTMPNGTPASLISPYMDTTAFAGKFDTRKLGTSMCITADYFWYYINLVRTQKGQPALDCSGSNKKPYALSEIDPDAVQRIIQVFYGGTTEYGGLESVSTVYNSLINAYSPEVAAMRAACTGPTGSSNNPSL